LARRTNRTVHQREPRLRVAGRILGESAAVKTSVASLVSGLAVGAPMHAAGIIDLADDCASPHVVSPDEVAARVMIGQRYETSAFAGDCLALAHALGTPVATDELHAVEASWSAGSRTACRACGRARRTSTMHWRSSAPRDGPDVGRSYRRRSMRCPTGAV